METRRVAGLVGEGVRDVIGSGGVGERREEKEEGRGKSVWGRRRRVGREKGELG